MTEFFWILSIAFGLTIISLHIMLSSGWAGFLAIDTPNQRSLHAAPIPRIGGVIMIPMALASALSFSQESAVLLALAAGLCAISFIDDRRELLISVRLLSHLLAAIILCQSSMPPLSPWGFGLAVLVLVWAINLYNFMDGADGLAGGMALFGFSVLGWTLLDAMPGTAALALCLAAAAAGFLLFNFSPAKVFMGDAGSVPLGFLAGGIGLAGWLQQQWPAWFPLLVFAPFVVDATATLTRRILRRENFWQAHRDHYYQRMVRMGWSHRRLALGEYMLMVACGVSALVLLPVDPIIQVTGLSAWFVVFAVLMLYIDKSWTQFDARRGDIA